jgi:hypothetical protein
MQEREQNVERSFGVKMTVVLAVASTLIRLTHLRSLANITPLGALSSFSGSRVRSWLAFAVPLAVMVVSDVLLNRIYGDFAFNPFVYACYALNVLWGWLFLKKITFARVGGVSVLGSVQFFLVTNFGVWLMYHGVAREYELSASGLIQCYAAGVPFFFRTLAGDLGYSALFFGLYAWAVSLQRAAAAAKETA